MANQKLIVEQALDAAIEFVKQKKFSEALKNVNAVIPKNPNHSDSLWLRGVIDS